MHRKTHSSAATIQWRVIVVDKHPLVRRSVAGLIESEPDLTVCVKVATCHAALDAIAVRRPDLVITGLSFDDGDGLSLVSDIYSRYADLPVVVLTMHDLSYWADSAFQAGARGFVSKREMGDTLIAAIRSVLRGNRQVRFQANVNKRNPP